jgi:uncharacterized membrane protein YsdA (DUF1294 family)/cold shock CspA family protein
MTLERGCLSEWNDERGFGFITPSAGSGRYFVHVSAFSHQGVRPAQGEPVWYQLGHDDRGRTVAIAARHIESDMRMDARVEPRQSGTALPGLVLALGFLVLVLALVPLAHVPLAVPGFYLFASAASFVLYASDKAAAEAGRWRTAESTLHLFAAFGGWPGALVAQSVFRHKTRKASFRAVFWVTVALNCAVTALTAYLSAAAPG